MLYLCCIYVKDKSITSEALSNLEIFGKPAVSFTVEASSSVEILLRHHAVIQVFEEILYSLILQTYTFQVNKFTLQSGYRCNKASI